MKKTLIAMLAVTGMSLGMPAMADTIRTSDGASCSFDADDTPFELEAYVEQGDFDRSSNNQIDNFYDEISNEQSIGLRLVYNFGGPKRLDCDKLYQMELRTKEAELKQLETKLQMLEAAQDIQW